MDKRIVFEHKIKAEFYDVDSMNVVWHGNYVKFLESARCAFLDQLGYNYNHMKSDGYAFPVVKMSFKYIKPIFFMDEATVKVILEDFETMLNFKYEIYVKNHLVCKASTSQACIEIKGLKTKFSLPANFHKALKDKYNV